MWHKIPDVAPPLDKPVLLLVQGDMYQFPVCGILYQHQLKGLCFRLCYYAFAEPTIEIEKVTYWHELPEFKNENR